LIETVFDRKFKELQSRKTYEYNNLDLLTSKRYEWFPTKKLDFDYRYTDELLNYKNGILNSVEFNSKYSLKRIE